MFTNQKVAAHLVILTVVVKQAGCTKGLRPSELL